MHGVVNLLQCNYGVLQSDSVIYRKYDLLLGGMVSLGMFQRLCIQLLLIQIHPWDTEGKTAVE